MKKLIVLTMILGIGTANASPAYRPHRPIPNPSFVSGYNSGYNSGYRKGKNDERDKVVRTAVATAVIAVGAVIIYKAITGEEKNPMRLSYKF